MSNLNPRYELYLSTTDAPTNWGFMSFICSAKREALKQGLPFVMPDALDRVRVLDKGKFGEWLPEYVEMIKSA